MSVVPAARRDDHLSAGRPACELDGEIDRLAAADPENGTIDISGHQLGELCGEPAALLADKMMVADIEFFEAFLKFPDDQWVGMAKIEDAAVAVAVDEPLTTRGIPDIRPLASAEDERHVIRLEGLHLSRIDVVGKTADHFLLAVEPDEFHENLPT